MFEIITLFGLLAVGAAVLFFLWLTFGLLKVSFHLLALPFTILGALLKVTLVVVGLCLLAVFAPVILTVAFVMVPVVALVALMGLSCGVFA